MVTVTQLDGKPFVINAELIESIEAAPDTIITLTTQKKLVVREDVATVVDSVIAYQRVVRCRRETGPGVAPAGDGAG